MNFRHIIRDVIIAKFSYFGIAHIYRARCRRRGPLTRVVVFHDVPDRAWFESMIATLTKETTVLTPEEFQNNVIDPDRINTLITFDDGYASWMSIALPVLEQYGCTGLFFINSGLLDAARTEPTAHAFMRESLRITPRTPLSWDGAKELLRRGHLIGGHARTHQNLALLEPAEVETEITLDKRELESGLGITMTEFAYPFGTPAHFTKETEKTVQRAGYQRAYSAVSRFVPPDSMGQAHLQKVRGETMVLTETYTSYDEEKTSSFNKEISQEDLSQGETFAIPRMCIESDLTPNKLKQWVRGGYDLFDMLKTLCVR